MDTYHMFDVNASSSSLTVYSTDVTELNWLVSELTRLFPKLTVVSRILPSGEKYLYDIRNVPKDYISWDFSWWAAKQLCSRGWEPYAVHGDAHRFRKMS